MCPAAALRAWGLPHRGDERDAAREVRARLVDELDALLPWLDRGTYRQECVRSDDVLDAVFAALVAREVAQGRTVRPGPGPARRFPVRRCVRLGSVGRGGPVLTAAPDNRPAHPGGAPVASLARRIAVFLLGVAIMAFGVAMSVRADLGTSPISAFPAVMSHATTWTVGQVTIAMNVIFVLLQILILRRRYQPAQLVQIPIAVVFGLLCDLALWLTPWVQPTNYLVQWLWTLLAAALVGIGVWVEVQPRLTLLPGEGLVLALSQATGAAFSTLKIAFDATLVTISAVLSLILMARLAGVREGTIAAAFLVGLTVKACNRLAARVRGGRGEGRDGTSE